MPTRRRRSNINSCTHAPLQNDRTPLIEAAAVSDKCVQLLLDKGALINYQNEVSVDPI